MTSNKLFFSTFVFSLLLALASCGSKSTASDSQGTSSDSGQEAPYGNPAAEGFRAEASDPKAIAIADEVMEAMGGRKAWDGTPYLHWTFFGKRHLLWDKQNKQVRVESPEQGLVIVTGIEEGSEGRVWKDGKELTDPESVAKYAKQGRSLWINDAYWLVMPYKLKDSGVALSYVRQDTSYNGQPADVLGLQFENVGDTPQNKYEVWVDQDSKLVTQWAYYADAGDQDPKFVTPWADYKEYSGIMLSGDRRMAQLTNIQAPSSVPGQAFETGEMMLPLP